MKIGYQGTQGSFSEAAAEKFIIEKNLGCCELIPMTSSENVCNALEKGTIDLGVVALENSIGGEVEETRKAMKNRKIKLLSKIALPISQCLFKRNSKISISSIKLVLSHNQALLQCKNTLNLILKNDYYPVAVEDTAIAAKRLSQGIYSDDTAVICSFRAGKLNNLSLIQENIQDSEGNTTYFGLIKIPKESISISSRKIQTINTVLSPWFLKYLFQFLFISTLILAFYLNSKMGFSPIRSALTIGGPFIALSLILTSRRTRDWINAKRITGYWSYYIKPSSYKGEDFSINQLESFERVAIVNFQKGKLSIKGWVCDNPAKMFFEADPVLLFNSSEKHGTIMYKYINSSSSPKIMNFNGMASLDFYTYSPFEVINKMSGWYVNTEGDLGFLEYTRITKEDFHLWIK